MLSSVEQAFVGRDEKRAPLKMPAWQANITTDPRFIYLFYFQVLFNRSSIPDFSILDPRSSILDPDFPVNLEVLLIKIILFFFDH